jgi:hypothetical protein
MQKKYHIFKVEHFSTHSFKILQGLFKKYHLLPPSIIFLSPWQEKERGKAAAAQGEGARRPRGGGAVSEPIGTAAAGGLLGGEGGGVSGERERGCAYGGKRRNSMYKNGGRLTGEDGVRWSREENL